jgi:S1-C subfamily serine protease
VSVDDDPVGRQARHALVTDDVGVGDDQSTVGVIDPARSRARAALVDASGNLVGINSLTTLKTQGQGFAIGVDLFKEQAPTLDQGDSIGFLGFDFIANGKGLVVDSAVDGSKAADAGFGSSTAIVTAIDGQKVRTRADYCRAVEGSEPGQTARVSGLTRRGRFAVDLPFL